MTTESSALAANGQLTGATLDALNAGRGKTALSAAKEQSDRFLKLLTTQLKNQDPLNPMDNAEMTSQMAQISTVTGVETLNTGIQSLTSQMVQLQALQGAGMIGREVLTLGDELSIVDGVGKGSFDLSANATQVKVEVLNPAGVVVKALDLGKVEKGRQRFEWPAGSVDESDGYTFRVKAYSGTEEMATTSMMFDKVKAVQTGGNTLTLQLARGGSVPWSEIRSLN